MRSSESLGGGNTQQSGSPMTCSTYPSLCLGQLSLIVFSNLGQYVSLKMLSADTPSVKAERERDVLAELGDRNPGLSGRSHIIELLDSFYHSGPNGQHMCLVYKPMGEHLLRLQARVPDNKLPVPLMKRITRQLLQALDYMHSCGWVHTGWLPLHSAIRLWLIPADVA